MLLFMFFLSLTCLKLYQALGVLWISNDQEEKKKKKIESKTIPRASDCSEPPPPPQKKKTPHLNQANKILAKFSYPKKSRN